MRSNDNDYSSVWIVIMLSFCLGLLVQLFQIKNTTPPPSFDPIPPSSSEYRYVEQRLRREGYTEKDAQMATQAILKFHKAQQRK